MPTTVQATVAGSVITAVIHDGGAGQANAWAQVNLPTDPATAPPLPASNWMCLNGLQTAPAAPILDATLHFPAPGATLLSGSYEVRYYSGAYPAYVASNTVVFPAVAPPPPVPTLDSRVAALEAKLAAVKAAL